MNPSDIIRHLCNKANSSQTIWGVFQEAFDETNAVELFKKRALLIEYLEYVLRELEYEEDERVVFQDIYAALSCKNIQAPMNTIAHLLTPAHQALATSALKHHKRVKREHDVEELVALSEALREAAREADLSAAQSEVIEGICDAVVQARDEHRLTGNYAIKKLYERLMGKLVLYREEIKSINSKTVKEKLTDLYVQAEKVNEIMGFFLSFKSHAFEMLSLISGLSA